MSEAAPDPAEAARRNALLGELSELAHTLPEYELYRHALQRAVELTASEVGYLHTVHADQENLTLTCWNDATLSRCTAVYDNHYPLSRAGIWADSVRLRRPVVHNDYPQTPGRKGVPAGHFPIRRHLGLPVVSGGKVRLVVGVGNKAAPYDERDVAAVQLVADALTRIIDRLNAQKALAESEERYRALFEGSNDAIFVFPLDGDGRPAPFTQVNENACALLGYTRDRLLAMRIGDIDARPAGGAALPFAEADAVYASEFEGRDGRRVAVEVSARRLAFGGRPHVVCVVRDVSARRRLEEQLHDRQRLEAVGKLAGGVAHEFNNLLSGIGGFAALLKGAQAGPHAQFAAEIERLVQTGAGLTAGMLAFANRKEAPLSPHDLNEVVRVFEGGPARLLGEGVEVSVRPAAEPAWVMADGPALHQALLELLTNAIEAMPSGGRIEIACRFAAAAEAARAGLAPAPAGHVVVSVADDGAGIPPEIRHRIFEPFFSTKGVGGGSGLGLAAVYGTMQRHHGAVDVRSEPGAGTTVSLYFPAAAKPAVAAGAKAPQPALEAPPSKTILLVDDNNTVRLVTRHILSRAGYAVVEAEDGVAGEAQFRAHRAELALVLSDMVMPRHNGLEFYEAVGGPACGVPFLFFSGYSRDVLEARGVKAADLALLVKPVAPEALLEAVAAAMGAAHA